MSQTRRGKSNRIFREHFRSLLFFAGACCVILACEHPEYRREELLGTYNLNRGSICDVVNVRADGRYTHTFFLAGHAITGEDTWSLKQFDGYQYLMLEEFQIAPGIFPHVDDVDNNAKAVYPASITKFDGKIALIVFEDKDIYFVKDTVRQPGCSKAK